MARNRRWNAIGIPQLVRINSQDHLRAFGCERDYQYFVQCIAESASEHNCSVHTFSLVERAAVFLCTPLEKEAVARFVQGIGRAYVPRFNQWYGRTGTLWTGRYRAGVVDPDTAILDAHRYVYGLPARIELDNKHLPGTHWSALSTRRFASVQHFLRVHPTVSALGSQRLTWLERFEQLCNLPLNHDVAYDFEIAVKHGLAAGSDAFKDWIARTCGARARLRRPGRPRKVAPATDELAGHASAPVGSVARPASPSEQGTAA